MSGDSRGDGGGSTAEVFLGGLIFISVFIFRIDLSGIDLSGSIDADRSAEVVGLLCGGPKFESAFT
jgi:hypothetical protein